MSTKCLVTTLKGKVNNPNLPFFKFGTVKFYSNSTTLNFMTHVDVQNNMMKVISGTVYSDIDKTNPITDKACKAWNNNQIFFNRVGATDLKIALNTRYIWCLGHAHSIYNNSANPPFKINPKEFFGEGIVLYNLKACGIIGDDKSVEQFFIDIYKYILKNNITTYERSNINKPRAWPTVSNNVAKSGSSTFDFKTFNGQEFYEKYLCMATDIANNTFYLYDNITMAEGVGVKGVVGILNDNDIVASYNYTTGEWTYYNNI